jgi:hypothetical protein
MNEVSRGLYLDVRRVGGRGTERITYVYYSSNNYYVH